MIAAPSLFEADAPTEAQLLALYPWQKEAIEALRENIRQGVRNQIMSAATGSGKTVLATHLLQECYRKGRRGVFVADRIPLIDQTSRMFDAYGIPHGVIQADHWRHRPWERIQVASAQTVQRRGWPDADLIIVDEAHSLYRTVLHRIAKRDTVTVGLTATPFTRGLGRYYDRVVTVRTTAQLIEDGYLAPYRIFAASEPDMTGAAVSAGEWTDREAEQRSLPIVGDIVAEYLKHGGGHKFICFGATVAHCEEIQRQFLAAGVVAGLYTYQTPGAEREAMLGDFRERDSHLRGLISVAALAKGFDSPAVECVIIARPLRKSLAEHIQMLGRGLRRDPDNPAKVCTILDHAGNSARFWPDMMEFFEAGATELDDGKPKEQRKPEKKEKEPIKCPECASLHDPRPACPECGHEYPRRSEVVHVAGTLSELTGHVEGSRDDRQAFYSQMLGYCHERGWQPGAAAHKYHERFGEWPNGLRKAIEPPSAETRRWIKSRMIAWSKSKRSAA